LLERPPSSVDEHERENVESEVLPQAVSGPSPSGVDHISIHSSEGQESPHSRDRDSVNTSSAREHEQGLLNGSALDAGEQSDVQTPHSSPPAQTVNRISSPQHSAMQARMKGTTPEQAHTVSQGPRHDPRYRIHKPQNSRVQGVTHNTSTAPLLGKERAAASVHSSRPSDEDLLMLVMRRHRMRDEVVVRLTNDHHRLQDEHAQLQSNYNACHEKLQETTQQWHADVQSHHVQAAQIRAFREKYAKLKQWAQEASKDYDSLRADGNKLSEGIQAIKNEGDNDANERNALLEKCDAAAGKIGTVKSNIAALRAESLKLETLEERLAQEKGHLREEKLRTRSHALYIERLEGAQRSMNTNFSKKQDEMAHELSKIAGLAKRQQDDGLSDALARVLEVLEQIRQQDGAGSSHKEELQTILTSVEQRYENLKDFLEAVKNAQIDQHAASNLQFSSIVDAVDKLKPDLEHLQSLERDSLTLSARLKEAETRSKLADREKNVAQLHSTALLQAHKELIRSQPETETKDVQVRANQLHDTNVRLSIELQSNKKEVTNLQSQLSKAQGLIGGLRTSLSEQGDNHKAELERIREKCSSKASARIIELETQYNAKAAEVDAKQEELQKLSQSAEALRSTVRESSRGNKEPEQRLQERDSQVASKVKDLEKLHSEKQQLEQHLGPFEDMKSDIVRLQQKCRDYDSLVEKLKQAQADKGNMEKNLAHARTHAIDLERGLEEATQQLQALQPLSEETNNLRQTNSAQMAQIKELSDTRRDLVVQTQKLPVLQKEVEKSNNHVRELEDKLKAATAAAAYVEELQGQLEAFRDQKDDLSRAQTDLKEKNRTVQNMLQQVSALKQAQSNYEEARQESQQKDVEMAMMQDRINKLEEESRRFEPLREHITDEEFAALSEPIVLSLKSIIHQSQCPEEEVDSSVRHDDGEGTFTRPRRAANRGPCNDSAEAVVVPDSQSQGRYLQNLDTSELSSPPEFLEGVPSMFDTGEAPDDTIDPPPLGVAPGRLPSAPALQVDRNDPQLRPGTSNEEMLLRSSDAANFSPAGPGQNPERGQAQVLVPASAHGTSPMKTRTGTQIRHSRDSTPVPRTDPGSGDVVNFSSPHIRFREPHAPNSAAKRQAEAAEPTAKRHKADMKRLATRSTPTPKSTRFSDTDTVYDMPVSGRKTGTTVGTSAPAPGKTKKKTNTTLRRGSRNAQYGERFSQAEGI